MTNWHINPQTLEPRVCRASQGKCPYGASTPHFTDETVGQHFKLFEQVMADYTLVSFRKSNGKTQKRYDRKAVV